MAVRLEKISMQGFKSFKRPVSFPIPEGFTVITGPNGSGKSNIHDAISFVLGRMSSRYLRAKKAGDLIFQGSAKKEGSDYAKVALHFTNKGRELPVPEEAVVVSRRINKEGISSYKLNGRITSREQIHDIFRQARLNPSGHNVIKQGDITKIIEMNPLERRGIIDEISGIQEYDEKKVKAVKELEKVEEKVREALIILEQKEEIITKLKGERDAALKYISFANELELVKASIVFKEYNSAEKNVKNAEEEIGSLEKICEEKGKLVKEIDQKMDAKENELESLLKDVFQVSGQAELSKRISKLESSVESKQSIMDSNIREMERLARMVESLTMIDRKVNPGVKSVLGFDGVHGMVQDLVIVPDKYKIAAEISAGAHMSDIVVDTSSIAVRCVKHLKDNRLGRARFLPVDRIRPHSKGSLPDGTLGWMSELVHNDPAYTSVMEFVFGSTAAVNDIDRAKKISEKSRVRMVTLDGDLIESSGAITGGFYSQRGASPEAKKYREDSNRLQEDNRILQMEIEEYGKTLKDLRKQVRDFGTADLEKRRGGIKEELEGLRLKRKEAYEQLMEAQEGLNRIRINRARHEANYDNLRIQWQRLEKEWERLGKEKEDFVKRGLQILKDRERDILEEISKMGPVNQKAVQEFDILKDEFDEFKERVDKIVNEKDSILKSISEIEQRKKEVFEKTLIEMTKLYREIYSELTGGEASLGLEDPADINSGLVISAQPPGKKLLYIDSMSGGEKSLAALSFLFTIQRYKPSPFYVLDEVDAALDKPNTRKVAGLIRKHSKGVQFIIVSHNSELIKEADTVYGISMEDGESKIIGIKLPEGKKIEATALAS